MEKLTGADDARLAMSINGIGHHRESDELKMNPNLVRTARMWLGFHQGEAGLISAHAIIGHGWSRLLAFLAADHRHALAVARIAANRSLNRTLARGQRAVQQRKVNLVNQPLFELAL